MAPRSDATAEARLLGVLYQQQIDSLRHGTSVNRTIPARTLASRVGVSEREVRRIVSSLRRQGFPVVSGDDGYWLGTPDDARRSARRLRAHALLELQAAASLELAAWRISESNRYASTVGEVSR